RVAGGRIVSVTSSNAGFSRKVRVIDGRGKFLLPGFVEGNGHSTLYVANETAEKYGDRAADIAVAYAQENLKCGVTTGRDSYGDLYAGMAARDRIERGEVGARLLVAGNIMGWGGPNSITVGFKKDDALTPFQQKFNDRIALNVGEDLIEMSPAEI